MRQIECPYQLFMAPVKENFSNTRNGHSHHWYYEISKSACVSLSYERVGIVGSGIHHSLKIWPIIHLIKFLDHLLK